ncbi:hypothetical protein LJC21_02630 [Bacteroides sp. OttesenSCG-928-E20]|nr:hypothetical protein [Bacteroides sp. OttesenSCG-928-E20]MDL2304372.1 hypothetical protein [Bacteroides sp. OttesenSCG-928-D19]
MTKKIAISYSLAKRILIELLKHKEFHQDEDIVGNPDYQSIRTKIISPSDPSPSKIIIDKQGRIFLPDYTSKEICMPYSAKTIFIFFLFIEEGIEFKNLYKYQHDLYKIYQEISISKNMEANKIRASINSLINISNNRIYEVCSIIRKTLRETIGTELGDKYCITGKRGGLRNICIAGDLLFVENEKLKQIMMGSVRKPGCNHPTQSP